MNDVKNLWGMDCREMNFLRQPYEYPTKILRNCSHLHCKVKLKWILDLECLPQPCGPWASENSPKRPWLTEAASSYEYPTTILWKSYDKNISFKLSLGTRLWEVSPAAGNQLPDNKLVIPTPLLHRRQQELSTSIQNVDSPILILLLRQSYENPTKILRHCGFSNE